tara:strand:- start:8388 stop:8678 length:291 start_codon:yes stop_codon:yes gene_type:complete
MIDLIQAILALDPNANVAVNNIDAIRWYDDNPNNITKEQIQAKYDELVEADKKLQYQRDRLAEYPDIQECIHAILDDDLTALQAKRKLVKEKYPKP